MTPFETWLHHATRRLSADSAARVRAEIEDHYHSALASGLSSSDALAGLGSPQSANREYRRVLLTADEARQLRSMVGETRAICARPILKQLFIGAPIVLICFASSAFYADLMRLSQVLLAAGLALGLVLAVPFLPVYTASRGRVYRCVKWAGLLAALALLAGPQWMWLSISGLLYPLYTEFVSMSIRRKLPVAQWPKALYL